METGSVFERLDPRAYQLAERVPAEIKGLIDAAFRGDEGAVATVAAKVSSLDVAEQNNVFGFLTILDNQADQEYSTCYVEHAFMPNDEMILAIKKRIVVSSLLKAVAPCSGIRMRTERFDNDIDIYQGLLKDYETMMKARTDTSDDASAVLGGSAEE